MVCKLNAGEKASRYTKVKFKVFNVFKGHQFTNFVKDIYKPYRIFEDKIGQNKHFGILRSSSN